MDVGHARVICPDRLILQLARSALGHSTRAAAIRRLRRDHAVDGAAGFHVRSALCADARESTFVRSAIDNPVAKYHHTGKARHMDDHWITWPGPVEAAASASDGSGIPGHPDRIIGAHDSFVQLELLLSHSAVAVYRLGCGESHSL